MISFADLSTFVMKPDTEIVIVSPPIRDSKLALVAGNIWVNVKLLFKNGSMEIDLNQAVLAVKGTTFSASTTPDSSTLSVVEGEVEFRAKATGEMIRVKTGESATATESGLSAKTRFDAQALTAEWNNVRTRTVSGSPLAAEEIFSNNNPYDVANGGTAPAFEIKAPVLVSQIVTYHWNGGRGTTAGMVELRRSDGVVLGPWKATLRDNVYWEVNERVDLAPGSYTVVDSDPATWAQNTQSGGQGIVIVSGISRNTETAISPGRGSSSTPAAAAPVDSITGLWQRTDGEQRYSFGADGVASGASSAQSFAGTWVCTAPGKYTISWNHSPPGRERFVDYLTVSPDGRSFSGVNNYGNTVRAVKKSGSAVDPVGSWQNSRGSIWRISGTPGNYYAKESGLGNSYGPAAFTSTGTFRIDYTWDSPNGPIKGIYEVIFSGDGNSATGTAASPCEWTRITSGR